MKEVRRVAPEPLEEPVHELVAVVDGEERVGRELVADRRPRSGATAGRAERPRPVGWMERGARRQRGEAADRVELCSGELPGPVGVGEVGSGRSPGDERTAAE